MQKLKTTLLILLPALVVFPLGRVIWKDPVEAMMPSSAQLPFFILLSVFESLAFGIGIWFLVRGWELIAAAPGVSKRLACWTYASIAWSLVSWWPHDNLHRANGMDTVGLLRIEYGFHVTLIIASTIIAFFFISILKTDRSGIQ